MTQPAFFGLHTLPPATRLGLLESLVADLPDGLLLATVAPHLHAPLSLIYSNNACASLTGYDSAEIIGTSLDLLFGPDNDPAATAQLRAAATVHVPLQPRLVALPQGSYRVLGHPECGAAD